MAADNSTPAPTTQTTAAPDVPAPTMPDAPAPTMPDAPAPTEPTAPAPEPTFHPGKAWLAGGLAIFAGVLAAFNLYKVSSNFALLVASLGIAEGVSGTLAMASTFGLLVAAIPAGNLVLRLGEKKAVLIALAFEMVGSIIGAIAPNIAILLASRFIEGLALGVVLVAVPSIISAYFPQQKRSIPMSIWSAYIPIGYLIVLSAVNLLTDVSIPESWTSIWWLSAALSAITFILIWLLIKVPAPATATPTAASAPNDNCDGGSVSAPATESSSAAISTQISAPAPASAPEKPRFRDGLHSKKVWLGALLFLIFSFCMTTIPVYIPMYMQRVLGLDPVSANSCTRLFTIGMIVGALIVGVLMTKFPKTRQRATMLVISLVFLAAAAATVFEFPASIVMWYPPVIALFLNITPAVLFTLAPEITDRPELVGVTMALFSLTQGVGSTFSGVPGTIIENFGYHPITIVMASLCLIGIVLAVVLRKLVYRDSAE